MLPARLEDLAQFVLVGRDKLAMVRASIRAMNKLNVAVEVQKQKLEEAQMLGEMVLEAETRIGEIGLTIPKATGHQEKRGNQYTSGEIDSAVDFSTSNKSQTKKDLTEATGFSQKEMERFQTLAENRELIEQAKQEARQKNTIATRESVLKKARDKKKKQKKEQIVKQRQVIKADEVTIDQLTFECKTGDVWRLGRHTLVCGDAYDYEMPEVDACITDPPYGINYNPEYTCNTTPTQHKRIIGDDRPFNPEPFLHYKNLCLFGANYFSPLLPVGGWIVWDKRVTEAADAMLGSPFELAWFKSINTTRTSIMIRVMHGGAINADSLSGNGDDRYHPTQKPVLLMADVIQALTKEGNIVFDPFCGSGSTLIACQRTNRTCIAYEISPDYCSVILQRFYQLTGIQPCQE